MRVGPEVIDLLKQGMSLNSISKKTGIAKSTLYPHYKRMYGKKNQPLNLNLTQAQLAEFLGIFAGDGCLSKDTKYYHYTTRIFTGYYERVYSEKLANVFTSWFGKAPQQYLKYYEGHPSAIVTQYHSKALYELLKKHLSWHGTKTYSVQLKNLDFTNNVFNLNFLKGLVDTDGHYSRRKNTLSFSTVSFPLMNQVSLLLEVYLKKRVNIYSSQKEGWARLYTASVYGDTARRAVKLIQPRNPSKSPLFL